MAGKIKTGADHLKTPKMIGDRVEAMRSWTETERRQHLDRLAYFADEVRAAQAQCGVVTGHDFQKVPDLFDPENDEVRRCTICDMEEPDEPS